MTEGSEKGGQVLVVEKRQARIHLISIALSPGGVNAKRAGSPG